MTDNIIYQENIIKINLFSKIKSNYTLPIL